MLNKSKKLKKRNLVTYANADSLISDQFRTVRANIQFLTVDGKKRTFLMTSSVSGEGKSVTTANLAVSMAQQKERVLLIDANLRKPIIHEIFKISQDCGLTNVLMKNAALDRAIKKTGIGKLDILPCGNSVNNPAELLTSDWMSSILRQVSESYDIVLIDAPDVLHTTETRVLANYCDGVVLVLTKGKTTLEKAIKARKVLELAHAELVGAIINEK
ncbi:CpsD/CapB family tyrosine-protein kinase [Sediminibacillus massiliensis]|uniref:CpsD/CapB family tyrosine-protein kinase n=1 Tax=Sediminibacillus massiliensis TaxID=1926277 RepID=UPI0009883A0A|nr:CpsD/CapB family tyrosine-protein kinase [Sediminibacillus massiliensis]